MEFGLYTFGEMLADPHTGETMSAEERIAGIIRTAKLADELGIDVFGLGSIIGSISAYRLLQSYWRPSPGRRKTSV